MADRLKVMRLKQKAKGEEDKIAISERIYFAVVLVKDDSTKQPEVPIFVNKVRTRESLLRQIVLFKFLLF